MAKKPLSGNDVIELLNPETFKARESGKEEAVDPLGKTRLEVTIDQLVPSDLNPRKTRNPRYEEIKESIRNRGLDHPPKITRRSPDDPHFMIKVGGNTRLEILRELYEETGDERFYRIECDFEPWAGDILELAGNMAENESRGDLLMIEKAIAAMKMRELFEEEDGKPLSSRELARRITESGWSLAQSNLTHYEYAAKTLLPLIPTALWAGMGRPQVRKLRKLESTYKAYWLQQAHGQENPDGFDLIWHTVLGEHDAETLDFEAIRTALDIALGEALQIHYQTVAVECDALASGIPLTRPAGSTAETGATSMTPASTGQPDGPAGSSSSAAAGVSHETGTPEEETGQTQTARPKLSPADKLKQMAARAGSKPAQEPGAAPLSSGSSLEELRRTARDLALELARDYGIDALFAPADSGIGYKVIGLPDPQFSEKNLQGSIYLNLYEQAMCALWAVNQPLEMPISAEDIAKQAFGGYYEAYRADLYFRIHVTINWNSDPESARVRQKLRDLEDLASEIVAAIAATAREPRG